MKDYILSIIIPRHNESEKELFGLLSSINNQCGVDLSKVEVIISDDCGKRRLDRKAMDKMFDFDLFVRRGLENRGPGVARQQGLDVATGKYVMFCDADDVLHSVGVLGLLLSEAEKTGADYLSSAWLEELKVIFHKTGNEPANLKAPEFAYVTHELENTWMHGKIFLRELLVENDIRFHDELRVHEDTYFLSIVRALAKNSRFIPTTTYVWRWSPNSITRREDGIYRYSAYPTFIKACLSADKEIDARLNEANEENPLLYKVVQFVVYNYFTFLDKKWADEDKKEYYDESIKLFVEGMEPYWKIWDEADDDYIAKVYSEERGKNYVGIEPVNIYQWVNNLRGK